MNHTEFERVLASLGAGNKLHVPTRELALGFLRALERVTVTYYPHALPCFLATLTQESDYFRTTEEYNGATKKYAPYYGRTFAQVTHRDNYLKFGEWCVTKGLLATPTLFVDKPYLLDELQWSWLGGIWYWEHTKLWNRSNARDYQRVANIVNRGIDTNLGYPAGWLDRLKCYQAWTREHTPQSPLPITGTLDRKTVGRLQLWVGVATDGDYGTITKRAIQRWCERTVDDKFDIGDVKAFQTKIGTMPDGDFGPGSIMTLKRFLNSKQTGR